VLASNVLRTLTPQRRLRALRRLEPLLYALWAAFCTLSSGRTFYGYMMKQTRGEWSAPLDDVFIHFDYARATAQGHPFEWVVGNGYSSGNTSTAYPFVLAAGYLAGFTRERLMLWAAIVAATAIFATLLTARRLFVAAPPWAPSLDSGPDAAVDRLASYLLPPVFLAIGALDWTLWSGMEVAFFLSTWGAALLAFLTLVETPPDEPRPARGWMLGAAGALMILTRPEAVGTLAVFGLAALWARRRALGLPGSVALAARVFAPGAVAVIGLAACNRVMTGEWSANGAIVKLAVYNPFMSPLAKWNDYSFNFRYEIFRNLEYHFTDVPALGVILPALGLMALAVPRTRPAALVLWGQILGWMVLVAFNGQVRWQNERYTMPAVAWLTIVAALGASALVRRIGRPHLVVSFLVGVVACQAVLASRLPEARPSEMVGWGYSMAAGALLAATLWYRPTRMVAVVVALGLFHLHQSSKMRDQKWFFGRACRNIRDQHVETGRWLGAVRPRRVLVGDAGALIYASGRPGLDIIGLGGYHALPFARAGVQGLTATIELMEHLHPSELPDVLAIYPSWWGILPTWFSQGVVARVPAVGNVICGGYEDVVYLADWHLLGSGEAARVIPAGMTVRDGVDIADLVSEKDHRYVFAAPTSGFTELRVLADPKDPDLDMLDGGRELKSGDTESMRLGGLTAGRRATLLLRTAAVEDTTLRLRVNGEVLAPLAVEHKDAWVELAVEVPAHLVRASLDVEVRNEGAADFVDYHVWVAQ
jgi:hypothetical protein